MKPKPCMCGREVSPINNRDLVPSKESWFMLCSCGITTARYYSAELLINAWNDRPGEKAARAEALEEAKSVALEAYSAAGAAQHIAKLIKAPK